MTIMSIAACILYNGENAIRTNHISIWEIKNPAQQANKRRHNRILHAVLRKCENNCLKMKCGTISIWYLFSLKVQSNRINSHYLSIVFCFRNRFAHTFIRSYAMLVSVPFSAFFRLMSTTMTMMMMFEWMKPIHHREQLGKSISVLFGRKEQTPEHTNRSRTIVQNAIESAKLVNGLMRDIEFNIDSSFVNPIDFVAIYLLLFIPLLGKRFLRMCSPSQKHINSWCLCAIIWFRMLLAERELCATAISSYSMRHKL